MQQINTHIKQLTLLLLVLVYTTQSLSLYTIERYTKVYDMTISDIDTELDDINDTDESQNLLQEHTNSLNLFLVNGITKNKFIGDKTKLIHSELYNLLPLIHTEVPSPPPDHLS